MGNTKPPESPASNTSDPVRPPSSLDPEFPSFLLVRADTDSHSPSIFESGSSESAPPVETPLLRCKSARSRASAQSGTRRQAERVRSCESVTTSATQASLLDGHQETVNHFSGPSSHTSTQNHALDPPRPAKDGMEWVWFPAGYWAERGLVGVRSRRGSSISKKWFTRSPSRANGTPARLSATKEDLPIDTAERSRGQTQSTRRLTEGSDKVSAKGSDAESRLSKLRMGFRFMSPTYPRFISPSGDPEGMYCKTKRNVGSRLASKPKGSLNTSLSTPKNYLASQTSMVLEGASSYFERAQKNRNHSHAANPPFTPSRSPHSSASPGLRSRRFGLAPWHRRSSYDSVFSVTSSVHNLLRGQTPLATPNSASNYFDQDGRSYPKVEISDTNDNGPTFLPSEARRINTPPISGKQTRGFFFNMTPKVDDEKATEVRNAITSNQGAGSNVLSSSEMQTPQTTSREWWDVEIGSPITPHRIPHRTLAKIRNANGPPQISQFELNLPEHLPKSPLCPKHPSHQDGGTGFCVYHGQKKRSAEFNGDIGTGPI